MESGRPIRFNIRRLAPAAVRGAPGPIPIAFAAPSRYKIDMRGAPGASRPHKGRNGTGTLPIPPTLDRP